ncbi:MAG: hypothetical protein DWQ37_23570 [Planctomycetota bacterium]|nr:MAG: hypothetical protein DWQ37_23570 [Planctomycetota bacterium]
MPKVLAISGMVVGGLLVLAFGADLAIALPFGGASMWIDVALLISGAALGYMGWNTYRELA